MSEESTTGFLRQFPAYNPDNPPRGGSVGCVAPKPQGPSLRQALHPFACLADKLPEAIRPEETVTLEIKAGDLMLARKAYLEGNLALDPCHNGR